MTILVKIADLDLNGKRVLVREDYNVPIKDGEVEDDTRIYASLLTLNKILDAGAKLMVMSHLGRPKEGEFDEAFSLAPVAKCLSSLLDREVPLVRDWLDGVDMENRDIVLCENVRFETGEIANEDELARKMAALCNVYVNDAFATAHRVQASTHGVAKYAPVSAAGPLLITELKTLSRALRDPAKPMVAVVGGSKVSSKITILESLSKKVDQLIVGGGIANTFLKAAGYNVGNSLYEEDLVEKAKKIMAAAKENGGEIPLPVDVVCAKEFSEHADASIK
ncbi:MAG: phosphoglycerate kinase, partial [Proteobacteria bacterium]|nr:phosphoglycerate kinase [Pseudomonadota bacterium]